MNEPHEMISTADNAGSKHIKKINLSQDFRRSGYFETGQLEKITDNVISAIKGGRFIAISGIVGSGKTTVLRQIQNRLKSETDVIVSRSYALEKHKVSLSTLFTALFLDLSNEDSRNLNVKVHKDNKKNTQELIRLIQDKGKNVVLLIDDAHDLPSHTVIDLKKLIKTINNIFSNAERIWFSVVLAGHPRVRLKVA